MSRSSSDEFADIAAKAELAKERVLNADYYMAKLFLADIQILINKARERIAHEEEWKRKSMEAEQ